MRLPQLLTFETVLIVGLWACTGAENTAPMSNGADAGDAAPPLGVAANSCADGCIVMLHAILAIDATIVTKLPGSTVTLCINGRCYQSVFPSFASAPGRAGSQAPVPSIDDSAFPVSLSLQNGSLGCSGYLLEVSLAPGTVAAHDGDAYDLTFAPSASGPSFFSWHAVATYRRDPICLDKPDGAYCPQFSFCGGCVVPFCDHYDSGAFSTTTTALHD